ncbi:GNAT family N-acetyltransferase [Flagellimonas sp. DF-77]|uniref:GNAT family N-acetyltransferase n=1 Tax=Flagellimonas algarum TaxID=3230298 RepID=UPI00339839FD
MKEAGYQISTDPDKLDIDFVYRYLSQTAYWSKGRTKTQVETAMAHSLCFGMYTPDGSQIGFARVATDFVVFAWLMDVFISPGYTDQGLGKTLIRHVMEHPDLQQVNGFGLRTKDAQALYRKFGFETIEDPDTWMFKDNMK